MTDQSPRCAVALTLFLLLSAQLLAQPELILVVPRALQDEGNVTGVAFANPSLDLATITLQYQDALGLLQADPVEVVLPPRSQVAMNLAEYFGQAAGTSQGWVVAFSDSINVVGFFLSFAPDVTRIDGAEGLTFGQIASSLAFPEIQSGNGSFTEITVLAFGSGDMLDFELVGEDGGVLQAVSRQIPAFPELGSQLTLLVDELFSVNIPEVSYVRVQGGDLGLFGFEEFGSGISTASRNAIPIDSNPILTPVSLFGAQLAENESLTSVITLINPTTSPAEVALTATPTGVAQEGAAIQVERILPAGGLLRAGATSLFGFESDFVGWLRVDSDISGLTGAVTFGGPAGQFLSSVQLQSIPVTDAVFSQVAQTSISFTGVTFLNPNGEASQVDLEIFNALGLQTGQSSFELAPGEHFPRLLPELDEDFPDQAGGFIRATSTLPIHTFELFGFTPVGAVSALSAVPPQRINGVIQGQISVPAVATSQVTSRGAMGEEPIFIVAIDPTTQQTQFSTTTDVESGLAYEFLVFSGVYEIFAGTDPDGDGFICDNAPDSLCGAHPSVPVTVAPGQTTSGIDIALQGAQPPSALKLLPVRPRRLATLKGVELPRH